MIIVKSLQCSFQDNCVIEVKTRRFCQKCRLDKCFKVGMKREWILTEEQKKQKRAKILENKMKKAATGSNRSSSELASNHEDNLSNSDIADDPSFLEVSNDFDDLAEFLDPDRALVSVLDLNADKNMMSPSFSPPPEQAISPQPFTTSVPSKMANFPDSSQQIENLSIDTRSVRLHQRILETNFTPIFLRSNRSSNGGPLNELEDYKLQELIEAWRTVDEPLFMEDYSEITDPIKLVYLSDIMIKRLIAWCKQIQSFRNRCQDDQIALLKGGCLEMMLMSASINFDLSRDCWVVSIFFITPSYFETIARYLLVILSNAMLKKALLINITYQYCASLFIFLSRINILDSRCQPTSLKKPRAILL